ncbi:putative pyrophosphatase/phosphodiesterase [Golovinomyces cichoracearum]|uniref:Putative pyrophosphatase/phosphodiesterase n=1 Tax=Golovinomyces cichoracearum TaxID=62708 RepID=A0A420IYE1_9PEZI|nr:putative pyrophosphatase/phosphodiesterase [Golovinomyces cichoracearum]
MRVDPNSDYYPLNSSSHKLGGESMNISVEQKGSEYQDTESEDELVSIDERSSVDVLSHDEDILGEEEELYRLLMQEKRRRDGTLASIKRKFFYLVPTGQSQPKIGKNEMEKQKMRKQRKKRREGKASNDVENDEEANFLTEIEVGVTTDSDREAEEKPKSSRRHTRFMRHKNKSKINFNKIYLTQILIFAGISLLLLVSLKRFSEKKDFRPTPKLLSNGTALFAQTTIYISLDGFRADFLDRGITPRLNIMREEGVSPLYMQPSFPSATFPNHYTLVTGLYPESHGIVSNEFWDEELKEKFKNTSPKAQNPKWWGGEPLWVTAEKQGVRTAVHMWPGSESRIMGIEPSFLDKFSFKTTLKDKTKRVLELLDKKGYEDDVDEDSRPQLIAVYVPNVDIAGHRFGPNTTEVWSTISDVDQMLDEIYLGLEQRNLTKIVNVVVVSDHGMATTDISRMIQLEDLIDLDKIEHIDGWPLSGLRLKNSSEIHEVFHEIKKLSSKNQNFEVYLRDENMPERYHFSNNNRIAPLWIIPKTGWAITTKKEFDIEKSKSKGLQYYPRGLHGYDNEHPLMRAIFVATGPSFPRTPSKRIKPFQNIEVCNIICDSLGVVPVPNNGTLRLPIHQINSQEADIFTEIPTDLDLSLTLTPPESQVATTTSSSIIVTSTATPSMNPSNDSELKSEFASKLSEIDLNWIIGKERIVWDWLKGKKEQLASWWED